MKIRQGTASDVADLLRLIKELAAFEHASEEVNLSEADLLRDGFGDQPLFSFLVAEDAENVIVGMALYYYRYSTWKGKTLYLEDLCVSQESRRKGVGALLFDELIALAKREGVKRFHWQVLDWNKEAIAFYRKYPTVFENDWMNCMMRF
ncbi:MAG: GNAT family N-acetyltransferase [Flavobacteriales bacterium]|jgi:GNAT superfamily N-acetyltransferase|nr:GNAT family N-acetyltransferase [Flavobacteriales bacterium]